MAAAASRLRSARNMKQPSRNRSTRNPLSYREETSDSEEYYDDASQDDYEAIPRRPGRQQAPVSNTAPHPRPSRKRKASAPAHRPAFASSKSRKTRERHAEAEKFASSSIQLTGKAMPWQSLPYHVLFSIFDYASRPLVNDTFEPQPSIRWLIRVALCCKSFAEPAVSVLYYSPPLSPPTRAHGLLSHLASQTEAYTFNYGSKVKYLELEASATLLHKFAGQEPIELAPLVSLTPQLRGIDIHLFSDNTNWWKSGSSRAIHGSRLAYRHEMVGALQAGNVTLRDWTWNHSLLSVFTTADMESIHRSEPFQKLRNLRLVNYLGGPPQMGEPREEALAESLDFLPNLQSLCFKRSLVNDCLLSRLKPCLQYLEITECLDINSSALNSFLASKGLAIRHLILDHNQSLNFSFLENLALNCPKLELLKADLRYFGTLTVTSDTDPKYDSLLGDDEKPTWPNSLQSLQLFHLRKWSIKAAGAFFSSLTDAAQDLPHLRQVKIKASLDASSWRDRVGFRDKWTERLRRVFLRRSPPPNPSFESIDAFKAFKSEQRRNRAGDVGNKRQTRGDQSLRLSRVEVAVAPAKDAFESDSATPSVKVRRSTRAKTQRDDIYIGSEVSTKAPRRRRRRKACDDSSSEDSALDDDGNIEPTIVRSFPKEEKDLYIQGLCDVVDVLIDNLRPKDEMLNEDDFLDDEVSGDEDWNGDDDIPGETRYAW